MNDDSSCALCCSACPCVLSITGITTTGFSSFLQYFLHRSPRRHSLRLFENNDKVRSKASCFKPWIKCALCLFLVKKWILHAQLRFLAAPSSTGNVRTKPLVCKWFLFYKKKNVLLTQICNTYTLFHVILKTFYAFEDKLNIIQIKTSVFPD